MLFKNFFIKLIISIDIQVNFLLLYIWLVVPNLSKGAIFFDLQLAMTNQEDYIGRCDK